MLSCSDLVSGLYPLGDQATYVLVTLSQRHCRSWSQVHQSAATSDPIPSVAAPIMLLKSSP